MKIQRQSHTEIYPADDLFDSAPEIIWNDQTKEVTLRVDDILDHNKARYNYGGTLTVEEIQGIIAAIAHQ